MLTTYIAPPKKIKLKMPAYGWASLHIALCKYAVVNAVPTPAYWTLAKKVITKLNNILPNMQASLTAEEAGFVVDIMACVDASTRVHLEWHHAYMDLSQTLV